MSAAIDYLSQHGLSARMSGNRVVVSPRALVTDALKKYIFAHRLELLAELSANDGCERRCGWTVRVPGYPPFIMAGQPITYAEALEAVQVRWPDARIE